MTKMRLKNLSLFYQIDYKNKFKCRIIFMTSLRKNLTGEIDYNSKDLKLTCKSLNEVSRRRYRGCYTFYENKLHDLVLKSNLNLNQIDISKGFESFNDFNQKYITSKNLKGMLLQICIQAIWDKI